MRNKSPLNVEYDEVFIIDCLTEDQYNKWQLTQHLMKTLANLGVRQESCHIKNASEFNSLMEYLIDFSAKGNLFCLHIITHGSEEGLYIEASDEDILWKDLRDYLLRINSNMNNQLLLNMSSCLGTNTMKTVDIWLDESPFFGLISYKKGLAPAVAEKINDIFYTAMVNGNDIPSSVEKVVSELNDDNLICRTSQYYKEVMHQIRKLLNKNENFKKLLISSIK